jgi:hypothetical protein
MGRCFSFACCELQEMFPNGEANQTGILFIGTAEKKQGRRFLHPCSILSGK